MVHEIGAARDPDGQSQFGKKPKQKKLEIGSREEFPDLKSTVPVKKNTSTIKEKDKSEVKNSTTAEVVAGSEGISYEGSETSSTEEQGRHLAIFNLPDISTLDLRGALSAFGEVTKVERCGQATKIW